jgi:hypothetical protein
MTAGNWFEIRIVQWPPSDSRSPDGVLRCLFPPFFLRRKKLTFRVATQLLHASAGMFRFRPKLSSSQIAPVLRSLGGWSSL